MPLAAHHHPAATLPHWQPRDGFVIGLDLGFYLNQGGQRVGLPAAFIFKSEAKANIAADLHTAITEFVYRVHPVRDGRVMPATERTAA